jgi:membrane-associated phospholipid phosphatase
MPPPMDRARRLPAPNLPAAPTSQPPVDRAQRLPGPHVTGLLGGGRWRLFVALFAALAGLAALSHPTLLLVDEPVSELARRDWLAAPFRVVTTLGGTEIAIALAVVIGAVLWLRCRAFAVVYPLTLLAGAVLNIGLKELVGRPRPPEPDTGVSLASFPSGHTLQATLLFGLLPLAVWLLTERAAAHRIAVLVSAAAIVAVGASRVLLGAHWPTDVVGGVLVGLALILVAEHVLTVRTSHRHCRCALAPAPSR